MERSNLYKKFSPLVIEAMAVVIKREINILRSIHSLPDRTNEQMISAIKDELDSMPDINIPE